MYREQHSLIWGVGIYDSYSYWKVMGMLDVVVPRMSVVMQ